MTACVSADGHLKLCGKCGRETSQLRRGLCNSCYQQRRRTGLVPSLVDASPARHHIANLVAAGWNYREIARAAHIDRSLIAFIINGRKRLNADTCFAICCIDAARREQYKAPPETPEHAKERGRKAAAARTPEERRASGLKAWETRQARAAARRAKADAEEEAQAQRERFAAQRRKAQQEVSADGHAPQLLECSVCGNYGLWRRRGMCQSCYATKRNVGGLEWLAAALAPQGDWADLALCAQTDPDAFFPEKGGSTRDAKKVCLSCEVRAECLDYALENEERFGIWGGLSERERRRLIKEREQPVAAHAKESA